MKSVIAAVCAILLGLSACSTTNVVHEWANPRALLPATQRFAVIAISKQEGIRRSFEDEFVQALKIAGADAAVSYEELPDAESVTDADLRGVAKRLGASSVLVTRLIKQERHVDIDPGYAGDPFYGMWPRHYHDIWWGYLEPPRVYEYEVATMQTDMIDAATGTLTWSATSESRLSGRPGEVIRDQVRELIKAMKQRGFLGTPANSTARSGLNNDAE